MNKPRETNSEIVADECGEHCDVPIPDKWYDARETSHGWLIFWIGFFVTLLGLIYLFR